MRISILALEGLFDTGLTVLLDAFGIADFAARKMGNAPRFEVTVVGVRKKVRSGRGLIIPVEPAKPKSRPDWVVVGALNTTIPETLLLSRARKEGRDAVAQ